MDSLYGKWYEEFKTAVEGLGDDELFGTLDTLLRSSKSTFAFNRKLLEKAIDVSWVEAIENGLIHVDNVLRNPSRTIEDVEEIVPIERSRKITVESVKHLAQHTDLIQSIDKRTGKITPSKVLNVHKEESLATYENKFVNTLIDRLYIFINRRYEKLAQIARDEEVYTLGFDTSVDTGSGGKMKIELKIETNDTLDSVDANGYTVWQRVEKLKKVIEGYKGSDLCMTLGNTYIRPPVMRTNAIMKNVELKACLTLWQYIESYDKVGYEINIENTAMRPQNEYVEDLYKLVAMNLLLFRSYTGSGRESETLKTQKSKPIAPRFVKVFDKEISADYGVQTEAAVGYISSDGDFKLTKKLPANMNQIYEQISETMKIETAYLAELEKERRAKLKAEEEAERIRLEEERKLAELRRIEEARREELERIERERQAEEERIQKLLEEKKREQEEEERERARLEAERQARLEEQRRLEEEERQRRLEEERVAAERERIMLNKSKMRSELGEAEGIDESELEKQNETEEELEKKAAYEQVTDADIEEVKAAIEENEGESEETIEDPREIAARMKLEQQKREKERREAERAQRLKAERTRLESKPFEQIRWEYSKNPIRLLQRLITYILAYWFHIIPEDTDDPNYRKLRADLEEQKRIKREEAEKRDQMEVYYRKYAGTLKYRLMRARDDRKFKKKRRQQAKNKPKPVYTPPNRTPEQQREIELEMKRLYREYHVSIPERIIRWNKERKRQQREIRNAVRAKPAPDGSSQSANEDELNERKTNIAADIIIGIITLILIIFCTYVLVNTSKGKTVNIFGKSVLKVVTGSMEPSIHTGDYIIIEKTPVSELKTGDIISFYSEEEDIKGKLVTHRIISINEDGSFVTKGDANDEADSLSIREDQIAGKYTGKTRFFIWLGSFGNTRKLLMVLVIIPIMGAAVYEVISITKLTAETIAEKKQESEQEHERLMREAIEEEKRRLAEEDRKKGGGEDA